MFLVCFVDFFVPGNLSFPIVVDIKYIKYLRHTSGEWINFNPVVLELETRGNTISCHGK